MPHGVRYADGSLEVESNDRQLKIVLSRVKVQSDLVMKEVFISRYYVKDGIEWERPLQSSRYQTAEEFVEAISRCTEFSEAIKDIQE